MELNNPRWYQLRHNIASYFKPSHAYGMKGDHVMLIAEHGEVWIVEGMDKQRFPVKQSSLLDQDGNPLCSDEGNNMNFSEALATALPAKTKKGRKITKPANSQTLF